MLLMIITLLIPPIKRALIQPDTVDRGTEGSEMEAGQGSEDAVKGFLRGKKSLTY